MIYLLFVLYKTKKINKTYMWYMTFAKNAELEISVNDKIVVT